MILSAFQPFLEWRVGRNGTFDTQILSTAGFLALYYSTAHRFAMEKQRAWVITTAAALLMVLASIPFLYDYSLGGGSLLAIQPRPFFSNLVGKVFQGYLISDLVAGALHYPSQVNLATGWGHHIAYIFIVETGVRNSLGHIFCLCCIMELPTFILGLSKLCPRARFNITFAIVFFLTRIVFHLVTIVSSYEHSATLSFLPVSILTAVLPLHIMWFTNCVRGFIRRSQQPELERVVPAQPIVVKFDVYQALVQTDNALFQAQAASSDSPRPTIVKKVSPLYTRAVLRAELLRLRAVSARESIYNSVGLGKKIVDPYTWRRRSTMAYQGVESADSAPRTSVTF